MTSLLLKLTPAGDTKLQAIIEKYTFEIMDIPFIMGEDITFIKGGNVTWI